METTIITQDQCKKKIDKEKIDKEKEIKEKKVKDQVIIRKQNQNEQT